MVFPYEYGNMFHRKMSSYKEIEYELYAVGLMGPTSLCVFQFEEGKWQGLLAEWAAGSQTISPTRLS